MKNNNNNNNNSNSNNNNNNNTKLEWTLQVGPSLECFFGGLVIGRRDSASHPISKLDFKPSTLFPSLFGTRTILCPPLISICYQNKLNQSNCVASRPLKWCRRSDHVVSLVRFAKLRQFHLFQPPRKPFPSFRRAAYVRKTWNCRTWKWCRLYISSSCGFGLN